MRKESYYRTLFLIAGLWNILAGFSNWAGGLLLPNFFELFGMERPASLFFFHAAFWLIIAFGIGYLLVRRDPTKNRGIVITGGLVGKVVFSIDCFYTVISGEANIMLLAPGIIDLAFAVLFVEFLVSTGEKA